MAKTKTTTTKKKEIVVFKHKRGTGEAIHAFDLKTGQKLWSAWQNKNF